MVALNFCIRGTPPRGVWVGGGGVGGADLNTLAMRRWSKKLSRLLRIPRTKKNPLFVVVCGENVFSPVVRVSQKKPHQET